MGNCISSFRDIFKPDSGNTAVLRSLRESRSRHHLGLPKPPKSSSYTTSAELEGVSIDIVTVRDLDTCISINGPDHHTDQYELMLREKEPQLVVRRGQPFQLDITLNRGYVQQTDAISFIFTVIGAGKPSHGKRTIVTVPLLEKGSQAPDGWKAVLLYANENVISVQITPVPNCVVGEWQIDVDCKLKNDGAVNYSHKESIFILFNPWCKRDQVYMEGDEKLQEYVLTDTGLIWRGTAKQMRPSIWKYAQFDKDILKSALYLLSKISKVQIESCSDPVTITRALSAAVNSPDDYGVLQGNWSAEFGGGTAPSKWVGSRKILQKFLKQRKPVKYAQCWVFAGVLTTVCRALGIPSRTVTNYSSAHDTHRSITVDIFVDENGEVMEELNSDDVWNYHVWNEVWMERPDLGSDVGRYDGWQALDASPQVLSEEIFRCGPASVAAIKRGETLRHYDTAFIYAEVNADKVYWRYAGPTQPLKLLRTDSTVVGQLISTKAVGKWTRDDITLNYKYPESSSEERDSFLKALKHCESLYSRYYLNEEFNDIKFDFLLRNDIVIGSPFSVVLLMNNKSHSKDYTVTVILRVETVLYTGKVFDAVKRQKTEIVIKARKEEEIKLDMSYEEYAGHLVEQASFNIACLATVQDTNYEYFAQDDFRVRKPDIKIKIEGDPIQGQEFFATASLTNPLPTPLKKGKFLIEGPGLAEQIKIKLTENLEPGQEAKVNFSMTPNLSGRQTIAAKFVSNELVDVDGFLNFMVKEKVVENNGTINRSNISVAGITRLPLEIVRTYVTQV